MLRTKKINHKPLLKYILRQPNSEGAEVSDDEGSSWYVKLINYFIVCKAMQPFNFKQKPEVTKNGLFDTKPLYQSFIRSN